MIASLLAAALLVQVAPDAPPAADEIVVTGERPRSFQIVTKRTWLVGPTRCALKPPSDDPLFDAGICQAYLACVPTVRTGPEMEACMRPPLTREVKAWQERHKAAMTTR